MKAPTKLVLIALFSLLAPLTTYAANNDLMVVFSGKTEVNMRAYNWIREVFNGNNINVGINATVDPKSVKAGQYKTVVVINTGTVSTLDPALKSFIDGFGDKKSLFLVNLFRSNGKLTVTSFTASASPEGVDGVTAASTWGGGMFGNGADPRQMHLQWVQALYQFMKRS
jgi:hypothetical protein